MESTANEKTRTELASLLLAGQQQQQVQAAMKTNKHKHCPMANDKTGSVFVVVLHHGVMIFGSFALHHLFAMHGVCHSGALWHQDIQLI